MFEFMKLLSINGFARPLVVERHRYLRLDWPLNKYSNLSLLYIDLKSILTANIYVFHSTCLGINKGNISPPHAKRVTIARQQCPE